MDALECPDDGSQMMATSAPYRTRLPSGEPIELPSVHGFRCPKCGTFSALGRELRLESMKALAGEKGIYREEIPMVMLLAAPAPGTAAPGTIRSRTLFHKMLFEAWELLDHTIHIFGKFRPDRHGPVYEDLLQCEFHLTLTNRIHVEHAVPQFQGTTYYPIGDTNDIGRLLLEVAPDDWREAILKAKKDLYNKTAKEAADRIHERRPEWQDPDR